jgi:hypothetical protein
MLLKPRCGLTVARYEPTTGPFRTDAAIGPRVGPPSRTYERGAQASGAGPNISATVAAWLVASVNLWQGGAAYMRGLESETDRGLYTEVGR